MTVTQILTGTLAADGTLMIGLAVPGEFVVGIAIALSLVFVVWLAANKFQMWSLTLVLVLSVLYAPFSITPMASYVAILVIFTLVIASVLRFFLTLEVSR
jgi:hypothetical protein